MDQEIVRNARSSLRMDEEIVRNARSIGLNNFTIDSITPGNGDCFYEGVVSQCRNRYDIQPVNYFDSSLSLRLAVVDLVRRDSQVDYVLQYNAIYNTSICIETGIPWDKFLQNQERPGTYAEEIFIKACSVLLGLDIYITSETSRSSQPFIRITKNWEDSVNSPVTLDLTTYEQKIFLGYLHNGKHFQSIIPLKFVSFPSLFSTLPRTFTFNRNINLNFNRNLRSPFIDNRHRILHLNKNPKINKMRISTKLKKVDCSQDIDFVISHSQPGTSNDENPSSVNSIKTFEASEMNHSVATCTVCLETRPVFHSVKSGPSSVSLTPWRLNKAGVCVRCAKDLKKKAVPLFSGVHSSENVLGNPSNTFRHNNMHFEDIPPFLKNLNQLETAMISKIAIGMKVHILRYGMLASKGHCVSLPSEMSIATELPRLPEEVGIIILKKKGDKNLPKDYMVSRYPIQDALYGLCFGYPHGGSDVLLPNYRKYHGPDHVDMPLNGRYFLYLPNVYYSSVIINKNRICDLPLESQHPKSLRVIEVDNMAPDQDFGPAENQHKMGCNSDDQSNTVSGIACPLEPCDTEQHLTALLDKVLGPGEGSKALNSGNVAEAHMERHTGQPLNELKTVGFFSMAFPTIFINGSCDVTIPRLHKIKFSDFVDHIYFQGDNRVSKHPTLKFVLLNMKLRLQALNQGSFVVAQQLNDAHLSIPDLREKLSNGDDSLPRKIINISANLPNTAPYWRDVKSDIDAMCFISF